MKYGSFEDRVDVVFETGQLIIRKLNSQDRGKYQSEILINGIVQSSIHTLTVLGKLSIYLRLLCVDYNEVLCIDHLLNISGMV